MFTLTFVFQLLLVDFDCCKKNREWQTSRIRQIDSMYFVDAWDETLQCKKILTGNTFVFNGLADVLYRPLINTVFSW